LIRRLPWTLRATLVFAACILTFVLWTGAASVLFINLMKFGRYYPYDYPPTYWQWWAYLLDPEWPPSINKWLALSGLVPLFPPGAFLARRLLDRRSVSYSATGPRPLYGESHPATRSEMQSGGIIWKKKLPGQR
jgi:hypothetical protein